MGRNYCLENGVDRGEFEKGRDGGAGGASVGQQRRSARTGSRVIRGPLQVEQPLRWVTEMVGRTLSQAQDRC